jgi:hypothetical protein
LVNYREALAINPVGPEAHFYLAVTFENRPRRRSPTPLAALSRTRSRREFTELAKEFSD